TTRLRQLQPVLLHPPATRGAYRDRADDRDVLKREAGPIQDLADGGPVPLGGGRRPEPLPEPPLPRREPLGPYYGVHLAPGCQGSLDGQQLEQPPPRMARGTKHGRIVHTSLVARRIRCHRETPS